MHILSLGNNLNQGIFFTSERFIRQSKACNDRNLANAMDGSPPSDHVQVPSLPG